MLELTEMSELLEFVELDAEDGGEGDKFSCAVAYTLDRSGIPIISPTNVNKARSTETFVSDLLLCNNTK